MRSTSDYLKLLRNYKHTHATTYGILRLGVFGSVARGEQTESSDVDVCVEIARPDMYVLISIKDELQELFGCKVDIVRMRRSMNRYLLDRIEKEALYV